MADWKFLKKPEFWVTTVIAILLAFVGGFFTGKSYVINGDFADLQNEYNFLNSSYNKMMVQYSQGIFTQNQQGNNLFVNQIKPKRELTQEGKEILLNLLPKDKNTLVHINAILGDSEAYRFAKQIDSYIKSLGYSINGGGVSQSVYHNPIFGQSMYYKDDGSFQILIGSQE